MDVNVLSFVLKSRVIPGFWSWRGPNGHIRPLDLNGLPSILKCRVIPGFW